MSTPCRCILVGHCGADAFAIEAMLEHACGHLPVIHVSDQASLAQEVTPDALLLVNRVLDGTFEFHEGAELIRWVARRIGGQAGGMPTMMLVSNYEVAQQEAMEAGAVQGFGKDDLHATTTIDYIRRLVAAERQG